MPVVPRRQSRYFDGGSIAGAKSVFRQRPVDFDPDTADAIIEMIANGESLNEICEDRDAPLPATFLRWCRDEKGLGDRYLAALEMHADVVFDEALSAAYDPDSLRGGLRNRALMTRAERMMPDKYGPRSTVRNTQPKEDEGAGIDYGVEVRRKIQAMADRMREPAKNGESRGGPEAAV